MILLASSPVLDGMMAVFEPETLLYLGLGILIGMLVGMFPGVTATMAVALASGFTLTLEPVQGLCVLLTIYVAAQFGDRIPSILINTPGTPASIATTFDGYPLAKQGKAGLALTVSAIASAVGIIFGIAVLAFAAKPIAAFAMKFGPAELFALVVFGLTMMVSVSTGRVIKGLVAGAFGLFLATIGRDPITGTPRFTFNILEMNSGIPFIAVIIGIFGVAEVLNQILTHRRNPGLAVKPITQLGQWMPSWKMLGGLSKSMGVGSATGAFVGLVPAVGGDIAGIIGWDNARKVSKNSKLFGKGSLEGVAAADSASPATIGGSVATTMALGVPGDSVMAVMIGSMMIWGIQPGPMMFTNHPSILYSLVTIMVIATVVTLIISMLRMKGMAKLLELPKHYLWAIILIFCMVGTYSINNSAWDVGIMLVFGVIGLFMLRYGFPAGPAVLGLLLGPLAESNLRRALITDGWASVYTSPIAMVLLAIAALALIAPPILRLVKRGRTQQA